MVLNYVQCSSVLFPKKKSETLNPAAARQYPMAPRPGIGGFISELYPEDILRNPVALDDLLNFNFLIFISLLVMVPSQPQHDLKTNKNQKNNRIHFTV